MTCGIENTHNRTNTITKTEKKRKGVFNRTRENVRYIYAATRRKPGLSDFPLTTEVKLFCLFDRRRRDATVNVFSLSVPVSTDAPIATTTMPVGVDKRLGPCYSETAFETSFVDSGFG
jgi:hypothetical protein